MLVFGVVYPAAVIWMELVTHFCAQVFFDPMPTYGYVAAAALVPASNLLVWKQLRGHGVRHAQWLAFANGAGNIRRLSEILERGWYPVQIAAGVTDPDGKAKYTGLHSLRHFFASWCINRKADGGLELPLKVVQARLGHSTIAMTADRYGHLFPTADDGAELAAAERSLFSV